ncbi:MAG: glycosyltransferase family 2 protein [Firmicutes bacterium]|nr:glycosyltransferase family 2 protein [Bacillota bacterium]
MLLDYLALASGLVLKLFSLYFAVMCLFFWIPRKQGPAHSPETRFACLIAARNEEAVIGNLIDSLKNQNYPEELTKIFVIPNNCTDDTEGVSIAHGAEIIRTKGVIRSKGDALHQAVLHLINREDIDAFLIFDADNIVDANFLKAMNEAFVTGAQVTKSRIESKNPYDSWVSGCYGLYYNIFNNFFNESRAKLGLSPKLIGTGLGIRRDLLLSMGGWNTVTIAEDTEFNADCVIRGADIRWVKTAITYDETPTTFDVSLKQRRRWIGGIMAVAKERVPDLFCEMRDGYKFRQLLDMMMILIMPYLQVASVIPTAFLIASAVSSGTLMSSLTVFMIGVAVSLVGTIGFALLLSILSPYETRSMLKAIVMFPVFTISWMPLCFAALIAGGGSWVQIRHSRAVTLGELGYSAKSF